MRFIIIVVALLYFASVEGKSKKKSKDESAVLNKKLLNKPKPSSPPAIIAIEIVDPNENTTSSKNSKRTIDSSLGYGYNGVFGPHPPPRYQVYKYSQNIPAYRPTQNYHRGDNLARYYQPGTTLFSAINHQGQVEGLSSHVPQQLEPQVPVIILRVLPSQLADPSAILHPNLPSNHPLAAAVNSLDIQSLLSKYVQNYLVNQDHGNYQSQNQYQQQYQYVQPQEYSHQQGLLTHENYPKETHTRVIFRTDKNKEGVSTAHTDVAIPSVHVNKETKTIQVQVPPGAYSSVEVQTPHMQYSYSSQGVESSDQGYQYSPPQQNVEEQYSPPQNVEEQYSPPQNVEEQYSPPQQKVEEQYSPPQNVEEQYSPPTQSVEPNYYYQSGPSYQSYQQGDYGAESQPQLQLSTPQGFRTYQKRSRKVSLRLQPSDAGFKLRPIKA